MSEQEYTKGKWEIGDTIRLINDSSVLGLGVEKGSKGKITYIENNLCQVNFFGMPTLVVSLDDITLLNNKHTLTTTTIYDIIDNNGIPEEFR